jgi:2-polyprenyl-3-methyl-5-hydroxy-6-metoxy-1,4-benzoquinol methylase
MDGIMDIQSHAGSARCLLCSGPAAGPAFPYGTRWNGGDYRFLACASCGATFIDPVPQASDFATLYARSSYHAQFYEDVCDEAHGTSLGGVAHLLPAGGDMLDFGCGNGAFLIAALQAGYRPTGVELDPEARAEAARNSGCEVLSLEEVRASGRRFDIIHLGDVLEHLPAPAATMRELADLLKPGGLFFLEGPLEDNSSLVFAASRAVGWAKRLVRGVGAPAASFPPFHLVRVSARAQRDFFEKVLGYQIRSFSVFETGWPYATEAGRLAHPGSAGHFVRLLIGRLSVALGHGLNAAGMAYGNRFIAMVSPAAPGA